MTWITPLVTTEVKKPTSDPIPDFSAALNSDFVTNNSPMTAPKNGPIKIPTTGIINGPTNKPIVLPHIPAFVPPNFFTPIKLEIESAANKSMTNKISTDQNNQPSSVNEKNIP